MRLYEISNDVAEQVTSNKVLLFLTALNLAILGIKLTTSLDVSGVAHTLIGITAVVLLTRCFTNPDQREQAVRWITGGFLYPFKCQYMPPSYERYKEVLDIAHNQNGVSRLKIPDHMSWMSERMRIESLEENSPLFVNNKNTFVEFSFPTKQALDAFETHMSLMGYRNDEHQIKVELEKAQMFKRPSRAALDAHFHALISSIQYPPKTIVVHVTELEKTFENGKTERFCIDTETLNTQAARDLGWRVVETKMENR